MHHDNDSAAASLSVLIFLAYIKPRTLELVSSLVTNALLTYTPDGPSVSSAVVVKRCLQFGRHPMRSDFLTLYFNDC